MRLLNITNPTLAEAVINQTITSFTNFTNWQVFPQSIRVLTGEEEAIYGWISALNLENGQSFGSLDMGGASAQKVNKVVNYKRINFQSCRFPEFLLVIRPSFQTLLKVGNRTFHCLRSYNEHKIRKRSQKRHVIA